MPDSEFLAPSELRELTGYAHREQQERVLTERAIPYKDVGRRLLVSRYHVREWIAGRATRTTAGPRLDRVL